VTRFIIGFSFGVATANFLSRPERAPEFAAVAQEGAVRLFGSRRRVTNRVINLIGRVCGVNTAYGMGFDIYVSKGIAFSWDEIRPEIQMIIREFGEAA
jgi:hypothetical protein